MKTSFIASVIATLLFALTWAAPVLAVDNAASGGRPDLALVRAKIDAKDYAAAITLLTPMTAQYQDPDVFNLLGFSYRKSGDLKSAATYYGKALDVDPTFKPAIEYQGELFLQMNDVDKAKANLAKLVNLCPTGCEEKDDLEKSIAAYTPTN